MNDLLKDLVRLQAIELKEIKEKNRDSIIQELRSRIPPPILGHYDRLMVRGKKGIIAVRNQVCTGCHMKLPLRRHDVDETGRYPVVRHLRALSVSAGRTGRAACGTASGETRRQTRTEEKGRAVRLNGIRIQ